MIGGMIRRRVLADHRARRRNSRRQASKPAPLAPAKSGNAAWNGQRNAARRAQHTQDIAARIAAAGQAGREAQAAAHKVHGPAF